MKRLLAIAFCLAASAAWAQVPGAPEQSSGGGGTAGTGSTNVFGTAGQISVAGSSGGPYTISLPTTITSNEIFSGSVVLNGPLSGTGLTNYLASPAAIGGTAAAAGTFSTLTDTGMTGGPFCVHETSGVLAATASDCGSGSVSITAADGSIVVSPSPLTGTGTIRVGTVPAASVASGALANGMTATTQTVGDNTTKVATDAFVIANAGGGGSLTVTDGTHSVASTTTLTVGNGFLVGGSAGSATLASSVPNRTVASGGATIGSGDVGGQVNSSDASGQTFTQPSTATAGAGLTFLETNQGAGVVTLSGGQTLNGLASGSLFQYGWASCTGNSVSADCFGFPGFGALFDGATSTALGDVTLQFGGSISGSAPIAHGGTNGTTIQTSRANLKIDQATLHAADSNSTDLVCGATPVLQVLFTTTLTATRTAALPAASSCNAGERLFVGDYGAVNGTFGISIIPAGSDNINNANTPLATFTTAFGGVWLKDVDGSANWVVDSTALIAAQSCTNQVFTALGANGKFTCSTVNLATMVSGQLPIANVGSAGLSAAAPLNISSAGAITGVYGTGANQIVEGGVITAGGPTGSATVTPVITYNAAGQLTAVTTATIAPPFSAITSTPTTLGGYGITNGATNGANSNITSLTGLTTPLSVAQGGTGVTAAQGNGTKVQLSTGSTTTNDCVKFDANGNTADAGSGCGSSSGGGGTFNYSDNGVTLTAGTYFAPAGGGGIPQSTEAAVSVKAPAATTVSNLQVNLSTAPGSGQTLAVTFRDGGSSEAVTCTISNAATTCGDTTHSFNVAAGDVIDWQIVTTGTYASTPTVTITAANGTSNVGVTSVSVSSPLGVSNPTTTPAFTCATCVTASSPGAGIAHFAGSTQSVTSSPVSLTADVSGNLPLANSTSFAATKTFCTVASGLSCDANSGGTLTVATSSTFVEVFICGGGGQGGGGILTASGTASSGGGGGGGGACIDRVFRASDIIGSSPYTVTLGSGGSTGSGNANGQVGGNSTFGSLITAYGGGGGGLGASGGPTDGGGGGDFFAAGGANSNTSNGYAGKGASGKTNLCGPPGASIGVMGTGSGGNGAGSSSSGGNGCENLQGGPGGGSGGGNNTGTATAGGNGGQSAGCFTAPNGGAADSGSGGGTPTGTNPTDVYFPGCAGAGGGSATSTRAAGNGGPGTNAGGGGGGGSALTGGGTVGNGGVGGDGLAWVKQW